MEPLSAEAKRRILERNPQVKPAEIEEYERLLAERFATDPDYPPAQMADLAFKVREDRLSELYQKLFGS